MWSGFIRLRIEPSEHGNEPSGYLKAGNILTECLLASVGLFHGVKTIYATK
jgi:hypothetical protein